ncbi:5'-methylthioadenosine/S-adenosylhomocysteine nucleosidase [Catellatospora citrea]|uniref:5'-methylthioadenosine/S-adenosylhomocysteine nucleosidase family protein n=1 Tax=Catellatospora citrea TaxID=53366 RepID=UPI0033C87789
MSERPVVFLTALNLEYEAVRHHLADLTPQSHKGTRFETGRLSGGRGKAALALVGKGTHPAAVLTERAIELFDPLAVVFVGVAGALWPSIALGDVVVATHVYAYHGATSEDSGAKARPRVWETAHGPDQIARAVARDGGWVRRLPTGGDTPQVRFGPIAAGEVVQDSATSDNARWIKEHYNDAIAIEMEAAGVAQAAHHNELAGIVVRGISDRADGTKTVTDGHQWQPKAAAHAAAFAAALAEEMHLDALRSGSAAPARGRNTMHVTNNANHHARVGVQAGVVHGSIHVTADPDNPRDLQNALADLREKVKRAHHDGQLDAATYAAAEVELDAAVKELPAVTADRREKVTIALMRLRGLLADVAGLAALLTALLTVVKG